MTLQETSTIMDILAAAYPRFYQGKTPDQLRTALKLWHEMFRHDSVGLVGAAVKTYTRSGKFPPTVADITEVMLRLSQAPEITELEAWSRVKQAVRSASMELWSRVMLPDGSMSPPSAVREFDMLPDDLKRLVGSPGQLAAWSKASEEALETVIQSNFLRSFRALQRIERERALTPIDIRRQIEKSPELFALGTEEDLP